MQRRATPRVLARHEAVLDVLRQHPEGMTMKDLATAMGEHERTVYRDVRRMRRRGDIDNIPATPNGHREPWLYRVTNDLETNSEWVANRIGDAESRFETMIGQAETLVRVTNGRTTNGRKARKIDRVLRYLMQELADIDSQMVIARQTPVTSE